MSWMNNKMVYFKWLEWQHTTSEIDFIWFNYLTTFKVILQKRSYGTILGKLSLNVPYQCLFRKNTKREIGHLACLGDICTKLTPFMPVLALIMPVISSVHCTFCCCWKKAWFREYHANLNDIDSKCSLSHSFQGHNLLLWVMALCTKTMGNKT